MTEVSAESKVVSQPRRVTFAVRLLESVVEWEKVNNKSLAQAGPGEVLRLVDSIYASLGDPDEATTVSVANSTILDRITGSRPEAIVEQGSMTVPVGMTLEAVEYAHIRQSLIAARFHRGNTVRLLAISRPTLLRKLQTMLKKGVLDDLKTRLQVGRA